MHGVGTAAQGFGLRHQSFILQVLMWCIKRYQLTGRTGLENVRSTLYR